MLLDEKPGELFLEYTYLILRKQQCINLLNKDVGKRLGIPCIFSLQYCLFSNTYRDTEMTNI